MDVVKSSKLPARPWPLLGLCIACIAALFYIFLTFPPGYSLSFLGIHIPYLFIFFILLFLAVYGPVAFFLKSALQGVVIAGFTCLLLLFRIINLTHPFFSILLFILFFCVEGVLWKRK
jgi:hypothetical protein